MTDQAHVQAGPVASGYVLVGGWPGAGKSTVAAALARELHLPLLAKDEIKEVLIGALDRPGTVADSQRLGRAAVLAMLTVARRCPAAVLDSTWFDYTIDPVRALPGPVIEIRCVVPLDVARDRYHRRMAGRHPGHLDVDRTDHELWGQPVRPLGVGPLIEVDTSGPVDVPAIARRIAVELAATGSTAPAARPQSPPDARPQSPPAARPQPAL
jgi:predicted kinase